MGLLLLMPPIAFDGGQSPKCVCVWCGEVVAHSSHGIRAMFERGGGGVSRSMRRGWGWGSGHAISWLSSKSIGFNLGRNYGPPPPALYILFRQATRDLLAFVDFTLTSTEARAGLEISPIL